MIDFLLIRKQASVLAFKLDEKEIIKYMKILQVEKLELIERRRNIRELF